MKSSIRLHLENENCFSYFVDREYESRFLSSFILDVGEKRKTQR